MRTPQTTRAIMYALAGVMLTAAVLLLPSCKLAREIDAVVWAEPAPKPDPEKPGETVQPPPPIVEIIASIAAALGFGGMTAWIRSTSKRVTNGQKEIAAHVDQNNIILNESVNDLNERLLKLEARKET